MLTEAPPEESIRFAAALEELAGVSDGTRATWSRARSPTRASAPSALLGRVLTRRPPFPERLHPVPTDLARRKDRAEAFARAWAARWGRAGSCSRSAARRAGGRASQAAGEDGGYETLVREVWV